MDNVYKQHHDKNQLKKVILLPKQSFYDSVLKLQFSKDMKRSMYNMHPFTRFLIT